MTRRLLEELTNWTNMFRCVLVLLFFSAKFQLKTRGADALTQSTLIQNVTAQLFLVSLTISTVKPHPIMALMNHPFLCTNEDL